MNAYYTDSPGGWDASRLTERSRREGSENEALIGVRAVGLNPADAFLIEGRYPGGPKPPFISGRDAAGMVLQGDRPGRWQPGDQVIVLQSTTTNLREGMLSEEQWVKSENLTKLPEGWSFAEGAAAPLVYLTALKALQIARPVSPGEVVVVTGASGGVGLAAVHLALGLKATVVALSRSEAKQKLLLEQGAHFAFSPTDERLKEKIAEATNHKGVDLVVETVGGPSLTAAIHLLGTHGRIGIVGVLAGVEATLPIPAVMFKRLSLHGVLVTDDEPATAQSAWSQIVEILRRTSRRPVIDRQFPLAETRAAFDHLRGDVFGKVVVEIA